jgi:predicted AAA+ superfamily ATPase
MEMNELIRESNTAIASAPIANTRLDVLNASWENRLIAVQGHRGSGKTTALLQYLQQQPDQSACIYISLDHFYFQKQSLYETVRGLFQEGYTLFVLDEVHKYLNWSIEIKSLYDSYKKIRIIFTGSSALQIYKSNADLSRRAVDYHLPVLSLREFIQLETGLKLQAISLETLLKDHVELSFSFSKKIGSPLKYFKQYMEYGCYPFYLESKTAYRSKLMRTTNLVLETDVAAVTNMPYHSIYKMKKLLAFIAQSVPFKPNITKLAESIEAKRETTMLYLEQLQRAGIIRMLSVSGKTMGPLTKPDKIYLDNPNLASALAFGDVNTGNNREAFFLSHLSKDHLVQASPVSDFVVNEKYTFEIGGKNKHSKQVRGVTKSYVVKDDLLTGAGNEIPLWLFGMLY